MFEREHAASRPSATRSGSRRPMDLRGAAPSAQEHPLSLQFDRSGGGASLDRSLLLAQRQYGNRFVGELLQRAALEQSDQETADGDCNTPLDAPQDSHAVPQSGSAMEGRQSVDPGREVGENGSSLQRSADTAFRQTGDPAPDTESGGGTPASPSPPLPPQLRFWFQAFIPNTLAGAHVQPTGPFKGRQVFEGPPLPFHYNSCFETDERGFDSTWGASSRVAFMIEFDTATGTVTKTTRSDTTFEVDCTSGDVKCLKTPSPSVSVGVIPPLLPHSQRYDVSYAATANDPCVFGSPDIAIRGNFIIDLASRTVEYRPLITLFPAIEMYADLGAGAVTGFTHAPASSSVFSLFVPGVLPVPGTFHF